MTITSEYETFTFVEPTKAEYFKFLLIGNLPSWKEAYAWSHFRMGGGPMTEDEYNRYLTITGDMEWNKKNADSINRLRSLTTSGFFLKQFIQYLVSPFTHSYKEHCNNEHDNQYQTYMDRRDFARYGF